MSRLLENPDDIRDWATARGGQPMTEDLPDGTSSRTVLQITFGQHALNAENNEGPDRIGGFDLVDWPEWLEELNRQGLVLKVNDDLPGQLDKTFELVSRDGQGITTDAAKQPAVGSIQAPGEFDPRNDEPDAP